VIRIQVGHVTIGSRIANRDMTDCRLYGKMMSDLFDEHIEEIRIKMMKKWLKADEILIYFVSLQHTNGLRLEPRT